MSRISPVLRAAAVTAALAAALPAVAGAAPAVDGEFPLLTAGATPGQLTGGPDGNVWVVLSGGGAMDVAKVTPDGTVTEFPVGEISNATGIVAGPDGNLWVTQAGGVVRFSPAAPDTGETLFAVAAISDPRRIVTGADGNLWTASGDKVIRITPAGVATATTVPGMGARGITSGGDGRLYIADFGGTRVVGVDPANPATQTFTPTGGGPQEVVAGPGNLIAVANPGASPHHVGRFTPPGTGIDRTDLPLSDPFGMVLGNDGVVWVAQFAANTVTRVSPTDGTAAPLAGLTAGSGPRWIARGTGDTLWVSLETSKKVARITGVSAPPPTPVVPQADTVAPALGALAGPRRVRVGSRATFRVKVSEAAKLTLRFERALPGRRSGTRCVAVTKANRRRAKLCTRYVVAGSVIADVAAGTTAVRFSGRLAGRFLKVGRYRLTAGAVDAAANRSTGKPTILTVVARTGA